jgi:hypothetical protein
LDTKTRPVHVNKKKKLQSVSVLDKNCTEMGISAQKVDDEEENVLFALQLESAQLDHGIWMRSVRFFMSLYLV